MSRPVRILILEDRASDAEMMERQLRTAGMNIVTQKVVNERQFVRAIREFEPEVILSDHSLPGFSGMDALEIARHRCPRVPFIMVSGTLGEDAAIECLRSGATDYVLKDRLARLTPAVERALRDSSEERERRMMIEQLRQAQKMEALGRLAGGVAHDFNNLVTIILGYSERAITALGEKHFVKEEIDEIRKAGERARSLTSQLLAFSRRQPLQPTSIDLNKAVSACEKMLTRVIGDEISLSLTLEPSLCRIKGDRGGIEQILLNLAVNARDAMPEGGALTLGSANLSLSDPLVTQHAVVPAGDYVILAVRDTGVGMAEEVQAHLFEPFYTTKGEGKGTGLGLSTVLGIVQQCGGFITLETKPNEGATFRIYFQRWHQPETTKRSFAPSSDAAGKETILIVEDDRTVRMIGAHVLKGHGYRVLEASRAEEAFKVSRAHPGTIHLLFCDVSLPGLRGTILAQKLRGERGEMKVLFTSGYADSDVLPKDIDTAGEGFLPKPYTPNEVLWKVRRVLDQDIHSEA